MVEISIYIQELEKIDVCNTSLLIILVQLRAKPTEMPPITPLQYSFWYNLGTSTIFSSNDQRLRVNGVNRSITVVTDPNHLVHANLIPWFNWYASLVALLAREGAGGAITPVEARRPRVTEVY